MTTEQKEAIEYLEESVLIYKNTLPKISKAIETVLNLIQEQEKEVEQYKKLYQKALDDAVITAHDNMHKDKIIDELAKAFKQDDVRSVKEIKQYFEKQAKEKGENIDE